MTQLLGEPQRCRSWHKTGPMSNHSFTSLGFAFIAVNETSSNTCSIRHHECHWWLECHMLLLCLWSVYGGPLFQLAFFAQPLTSDFRSDCGIGYLTGFELDLRQLKSPSCDWSATVDASLNSTMQPISPISCIVIVLWSRMAAKSCSERSPSVAYI